MAAASSSKGPRSPAFGCGWQASSLPAAVGRRGFQQDHREELRRALRLGPLALGYVHTVWSLPRLNAHLKAVTGISFCKAWMQRLVTAEGYVYRRPKHTLKGRRDERAFRKAQRQLNRLKKGRYAQEPTTNSGTPTPLSFTSIPT
jgi:hypothetical protein